MSSMIEIPKLAENYASLIGGNEHIQTIVSKAYKAGAEMQRDLIINNINKTFGVE